LIIRVHPCSSAAKLSSNMSRDFDVILYGATGFTGRQTVA
jgi:hypothetical protein